MGALIPDCKKKLIAPLGSLLPLEKKIKEFPKAKPKKVILIAGPTACGKTSLSLLLANMLGAEIVSTDSMQVFRGMDIGTAKVIPQQREAVQHHLIDVRDIQEQFNVVDYYYEACQCVESIMARDRVPILCGGTGFYFRAFLYGPPNGPPSIPAVRRNLDHEMKRLGSEVLYELLKDFDPVYAATITSNDKHKITRALEIIILTGEKVSGFDWKQDKPLSDYAFHCWFVYRPREQLYPVIDSRCEQMIERGLIDEVKELDKKGIRLNSSASQAIGYRQCLTYLDSAQTDADYEKFVKEFKMASRNYAKRQFTWFRKEPLFHWLNMDIHDIEIAAEMIAQEYLSAQ